MEPRDPTLPREASLTDIYYRLGEIAGEITGLHVRIGEKGNGLDTAMVRIREVESKVNVGVGLAILASVLTPLLFAAIKPSLTIQSAPPPHTARP
jgi:hypothetical protein